MMTKLAAWILWRLLPNAKPRRRPDFVIGANSPAGAYLERWFLIPRNRFFNIYLHHFLRDDDDRALHDHPWFWCSFMLAGRYVEHTIAAGGIQRRNLRVAGSLAIASPWRAHRVELVPYCQAWTLFITGPRLRSWGFHCPERGWVHWQQFTAADNAGEIGPGCDA